MALDMMARPWRVPQYWDFQVWKDLTDELLILPHPKNTQAPTQEDKYLYLKKKIRFVFSFLKFLNLFLFR